MDVGKPNWTPSSFLLYLGGLTVLAAALGSLAYLSARYGSGALVAWALLQLVVLRLVAGGLRRRGAWIAAGVFAVAIVAAWIAFLAVLFTWWGWSVHVGSAGPFAGWHWALWAIELLAVAAAVILMRTFRFPLLLVYVLAGVYLLGTDLVSGGGNWSAVVTLVFGLAFLVAGLAVDPGPRRAYGFWCHLASGLLVGGALLFWWHSSELDWALLATAGVLFILLGGATGRSTWAVLGAAGVLAAATHWTLEWVNVGFSLSAPSRTWVPFVVFAVVGFGFVALGLALDRRRGRSTSAPVQAAP